MGYPYFNLVEQAYNEMKAEGKIPTGNVDFDKGQVTQRAGYYSYQQDSTMGVLEKTSGNNYQGYSVDIIMRTNGDYYDVMTDNGVEAVPVNGGPSHDDELIPRWRKPTRELAQLPEDGGGNGNGDGNGDGGTTPTPPVDLQPVLDAIAASEATVLNALAAAESRIQENVTAQGNETRDLINHFADQVDYWAGIILGAWFLLNRRQDEPPPPSDSALRQRIKKAILISRRLADGEEV